MGKACFHCTRILVIIFNFLFVLIGCAIVGISIFLYVDGTMRSIKENLDEGQVMIDIILFTAIGIGGITIVISTFGCCGAYHESECLLGTYFFCLFVIIAAEIAAVAVGFIKLTEEQVSKSLEKALLSSIEKYKDTGFKNSLPQHLRKIQDQFDCCGANGATDYVSIPNSIENAENLLKVCNFESPVDAIKKAAGMKGCVDRIMETMKANKTWIIVVACSVLLFEIIAMIVALVLCCKVCRAGDGYVGVPT